MREKLRFQIIKIICYDLYIIFLRNNKNGGVYRNEGVDNLRKKQLSSN